MTNDVRAYPERVPENPDSCSGSVKPNCLNIDFTQSDYDCAAGAIWPTGIEIAKPLDFDGDGKADLVSWTKNGWKIDLSSVPVPGHPELVEGLGAWDLQLNIPMTMGRWVWPVAEDYNSDGRTDLAIYDKEHGVWYIKFTTNKILNTGHGDPNTGHGDPNTGHGEPVEPWTWDWQVTLPYHDELNRNVWQAKYGRPVPGDYNGDGWIDLALQTSDGYWRIDYGGPDRSNYGSFDLNVKYLTDAQLSQAPGWAYLPVQDQLYLIAFKIPDTVTNAGQIITMWTDGSLTLGQYDINFGDSSNIPMSAAGFTDSLASGVKSTNGSWSMSVENGRGGWILDIIAPNGLFGGRECHPFLADCDSDGKDDRAVQCPTEFRIALSSTGQVLRIPLGYNTNEFTLPGKPYFGGISYAQVQNLIQQQLNASSAPPIIPVDMFQSQLIP